MQKMRRLENEHLSFTTFVSCFVLMNFEFKQNFFASSLNCLTIHILGSSLQVLQTDKYYSPSSSRSHSPARTDSTSGSRPTSGTYTPREDLNQINKSQINTVRDEKRTAYEGVRTSTPSRLRSLPNRRKSPSFSSDSTISSDSDLERNGQRNSGPRPRRGHPLSNRTKEHSTNSPTARQKLHRRSSGEGNRGKKTVSWNESPTESSVTNMKRDIPNEKPRVPLKPPARTARTPLRGTGTTGYVQMNRNPTPRNGVSRSVENVGIPSVIVQQPVKPIRVGL